MSTRLTPVATLIDTKQQSATTSFSTQIVKFSLNLFNRRDARVESHTHIPLPKERLLGRSYQRNQIYLHSTKPRILGYSVTITKTGRQSNLWRNQLPLGALDTSRNIGI